MMLIESSVEVMITIKSDPARARYLSIVQFKTLCVENWDPLDDNCRGEGCHTVLFLTGFEIKPSICSSRFNLSKHEGSPVVMRRWIYSNAGIFATKSKSQVGYYISIKTIKCCYWCLSCSVLWLMLLDTLVILIVGGAKNINLANFVA